jgi:hypothetical protein
MRFESLRLRSVQARAVLLKLERPVFARIATLPDWPVILIDLLTEEGIVGRSYLEPYTAKAMRYLIPALHDFGDLLKGPAPSVPPGPTRFFGVKPTVQIQCVILARPERFELPAPRFEV